mgnify:FL=1
MLYYRPMYSVVVIPPKGKKYVVKAMSSNRGEAANLVTSLTLTESKGQLAQRATIKMFNRYIDGLGYPSNLFPVKSRVFIYAKGAGVDKGKEVFRGYVWETNYTRSDSSELTLTCYDNLIYFMNSEALHYFSKGKKTKEIVSTILKKRGVKVKYNYSNITHPKLPLSGTLADILTSKVLDEAKKKMGTKYVIKSVKDVVHIDREGSNQTIYRIPRDENGLLIQYARSVTMDGMVTNVVVTGKTDENGKTKVETRIPRNKKTYGTLTRVIHKDEDTKLSEIKKEAKYILDENALPHKEYDITAMDIPWVRKGDKVLVQFDEKTLHGCIVNEITHNGDNNTMNMNVRRLKKLNKASDKKLACPSKTLRSGSQGSAVKDLQKCLNQVMSSGLAVDGIFGSNTYKAVKRFQKKYKLVVDGIFGPKSIAKMKSALK